jgi:hypothetical protein
MVKLIFRSPAGLIGTFWSFSRIAPGLLQWVVGRIFQGNGFIFPGQRPGLNRPKVRIKFITRFDFDVCEFRISTSAKLSMLNLIFLF